MSILYFDISAALVLIFLIDSFVGKYGKRSKAEKAFMLVFVISFLATAFDIISLYLDVLVESGETPSRFWLYFNNTTYFFLHNLTIPMYLAFVITLADAWHRFKKHKFTAALMLLPTAVMVAALLTNLFTGAVFYFDENNVYFRGEYMSILYITALLNAIISTICLILFRKLFSRSRFFSLISMLPFELCAVIIQMIYQELQVEIFANAVALFLVIATVGRPEEIQDSVTHLRNLNSYESDTERSFTNQKPFTTILIDISNYISLHQMLGYDGATELLKATAKSLLSIDKALDTHAELYHIQKGHFRFVLSGRHTHMAKEAAERINGELKKSVTVNEIEINRLAYVCIINCPEDVADAKTMLRMGLNIQERLPYTGEVLYASELAGSRNYELSGIIDKIIDDAIANKKFEVYYQPIYSVEKKRFVFAEALIRLNDEKYGFISPGFFIAAAERSGAIHKIGDIVMEEVCGFMAGDAFKTLGLDHIEVNLSVSQCMSPNLSDKMREILRMHSISPEMINLEITETAVSRSQSTMTENIDRLCEAGFKFSLDDYGTGYSNISKVAFMPLEIVKLDKSFVDLADEPRMWSILQNTVKMIKDLNLKIVVEGIETEQMLKKFVGLECDFIQGYYFSKPLPRDEFIKFIRADIQK